MLKFVEHFFWIAAAVDPIGDHPDEMWDEEDGFFYDVLRLPDGTGQRLKVRSLVGLLPLCATTVIRAGVLAALPRAARAASATTSTATATCSPPSPTRSCPASTGRRLLVARQRGQAAPDPRRGCSTRSGSSARTASARSPAGTSTTRTSSTSKGVAYAVQYEPAESTTGMFGGNSNWRGPVWFPINLLIIRALLQHYRYYGDDVHDRVPDRLRRSR